MSNNPQNYIDNPLNFSKSKQSFTFAKSKRFIKNKKMITQATYRLPSTLEKRTTSFGVGQKNGWLSKSGKTPAPGSYEVTNGIGKGKQNGVSFAVGRDQTISGSFLQMAKSLARFPSPQRYNPKYETMSKKNGYIGQRLITQMEKVASKKTPGPGNYDTSFNDLKRSGNYVLSTYKKNGSPRYYSMLSHSKIDRKRSLSPLFYDTIDKQIGKHHLSKHKSVVGRTFCRSKREGMADKQKSKIPGSKYRRFSQFGGNYN